MNIRERWNLFSRRIGQATVVTRTRTLLESMSPRDRRLLTMLISFLVLSAIALGYYSANNYMKRQQQEISRKQEQLQRVLEVRLDHQKLKAQIAGFEEELSSNSDFNVTSFLERTANDIGFERTVNIQTSGETAENGYREISVEVKVRKAPLPDIVKYLYEIETAPQRLTVESLRIRTAFGSREKLDADMEITLLAPQEA